MVLEPSGVLECAFLIGARCRADWERPFSVTSDFHQKLKVVGCQSFKEYLEWDNDRKVEMPELPLEQMGVCGSDSGTRENLECGDGNDAVPMSVLQKSGTDKRGNSRRKNTTGRNMTHPCNICGVQAVVHEDDGSYKCYKHHEMYCKGLSDEKMKKLEEQNG